MMGRRYLITIGSPECPALGLSVLPRVAGDVQRITSLLTDPVQGYEHALAEELPLGATARQIEDSLCAWFASDQRSESDCVVVYVSGHGDSGAKFRDHCLFTRDSDPRRPNSIIRTAEMVRWFFDGEGDRPQNVLLILDVCYAGQGAGEAGAELMGAQSNALRAGGAGFWVIAASDPNTEAWDGAFVNALLAVMKDEAWLPPGGGEFLSPASLTEGVNGWFQQKRQAQRALFYTVAGGRLAAPFIKNPGFNRDLDGIPVDNQAHWDPKARGVDVASVPSWFFTGRHQALRELSSWLQAERSHLRARVVTGGPGSGKSAVLGWLVLATRDVTRQAMKEAGLLADSTLAPPLGGVTARVHARGMRLADMMTTLAAALSSNAREPSALFADLSSRPGPIGIIVDSLDESAEASAIERELLAGLAACPPVRLIVGSRRRNGRPPLEGSAVVVDLDDALYFNSEDVSAYVMARLTSPTASYRTEESRAHAYRVAEAVAQQAGYSFLYARLVSRSLAQVAVPVNTARPGWQAALGLPADLPAAFGADLERFDTETRRRFVDLLVPLAYARGKGLPQKNVWTTVASRIAGREYTNGDLRDLKEQAGYYLVQDTESGSAVFRLFHQSFAEYLQDLTREEDVERSFAEALLSLLPSTPAGVEPWSQAGEPYLLDHFPSHAGAGGLLEKQMESPGFLLHVSPEALLPELHRLSSPEGLKAARAYRRASHWIRNGDPEDSLAYLLWGAYQHGARGLAERLQALRPRLPWVPEWAAWQEVISGHVLGQGGTAVTALTTGQDEEGTPVAICGYDGGTIRVWNLATSEKLLEYRPTRLLEQRIGLLLLESKVTHLAYTVWRGKHLIIAAWDEGSLAVLGLQDGDELGWWRSEFVDEEPNSVRAFCVVPAQEECLLIAALKDSSLRVWQLPELGAVLVREKAAAASFYALAPIEFQGECAVVSGTDSVTDGEETETRPVRIRRVRDLEILWQVSEGEVRNALTVRVGRIGDANWIALRGFPGNVILLSPETGGRVTVASGQWSDAVSNLIGFLHHRDKGVVLIGLHYSRFRMFLLTPGAEDGKALEVEELPVKAEIQSNLWTGPVELNRRPMIISAEHRQLRVWDVEELLITGATRIGAGDPGFGGAQESALTAVDAGESRIVTGHSGESFSDLRLWDSEGKLLWMRRFDREPVQDVAIAETAAGPVIVWVTGEGLLHSLSAVDGSDLRGPIKTGEDALALSVWPVQGRPAAIVAVNLKRMGEEGHYVVRAWDLATGDEIPTFDPRPSVLNPGGRRWKLESWGYFRNKKLYCVDARDWEGKTLVAFAGPHGEVRVMDLGSLEEVDRWAGGSEGYYVHSLALALCGGRPLAFAGDERGTLFARDLARGEAVGPRLEGMHRGGIEALEVLQTPAGAFLASGGADGTVNLWTPDLVHKLRIETERPVVGLAAMGPDRLAVGTDRGLTVLRLDWDAILS